MTEHTPGGVLLKWAERSYKPPKKDKDAEYLRRLCDYCTSPNRVRRFRQIAKRLERLS
jgi:hypothetical protein